MKEKDFRFIENLATKEKGVSTINLFNSIDEESARVFIEEFKWLGIYEDTTRIDIRINSVGGSMIHGWSIADTILNSTVPTRSICVGVAASMASVIMAAADEACMMSYASIMIHNPFYSDEPDGVEDEQLVTFRAQLVEMYVKRWGMSSSEVEKLMNGNEGQDGTWFKATEALNKGIVSKVIKATPQQAKSFKKVENEIINSSTAADLIQSKFQEVINNLKETETKEHSMKEVKAKLGLEEAAAEAVVLTKVSALMDEAKNLRDTLNTLKGENATLKIDTEAVKNELGGVKETLAAKEGEISVLSAKVQEFESKEVAAENARREGIVDLAVSDGKINAEDKDLWVSLFAANPTHAEQALAKLQAVGSKKKLSTQIKDEADAGEKGKDAEIKLPSVTDIMAEIEPKRK